jgi:hypothetical protein
MLPVERVSDFTGHNEGSPVFSAPVNDMFLPDALCFLLELIAPPVKRA